MDLASYIKLLVTDGKITKDFIDQEVTGFPCSREILLALCEKDQFIRLVTNGCASKAEINLLTGELYDQLFRYNRKKDYLKEPGKLFLNQLGIELLERMSETTISDIGNSLESVAETDNKDNPYLDPTTSSRVDRENSVFRQKSDRIFGIDLGTTNTVISFTEGTNTVVVPSAQGDLFIPSVVAINKKKKILAGKVAQAQQATNPENTYYCIKRLIGESVDKAPETTKALIKEMPFGVIEDGGMYKLYSPILEKNLECEFISAQVLIEAKSAAEKYTGEAANKCVLTVPAYFNHNQRVATRQAAEIAGLEVVLLINEPTAAALAYGTGKKNHSRILVADLGGGTFDLSLVESDESDWFNVVATDGDSRLGGEDFTHLISELLVCKAAEQNQNIRFEDQQVIIEFRNQAERLKCLLSFDDSVDIIIPFLPTSDGSPHSFECNITRQELDQACSVLYKRIQEKINEFMCIPSVLESGIDFIVLAGGSSRLPLFQQILSNEVGCPIRSDVNPDQIVASGASLCASILQNGRNIQELICDVTPLTLGTQMLGDLYSPIIPANSSLPCSFTELYTTIDDYQESVRFEILQGERLIASENIMLGSFILSDLEIARRGVPNIELTFEMDIDGILHCTSLDKKTNSTNGITILHSMSLSKAKVAELKRYAYEMKDSDELRASQARTLINKINEIEKLLNLADKKKVYCVPTADEMEAIEFLRYIVVEDPRQTELVKPLSVLRSYLGRD